MDRWENSKTWSQIDSSALVIILMTMKNLVLPLLGGQASDVIVCQLNLATQITAISKCEDKTG